MNLKLTMAIALLATLPPAQAAESEITLQIGAAVKNVSEVRTAPGQSTLSIVAEGAGKISLGGETVRFHVLCTMLDTLNAKEVIAGVGDCEFKSTEGGTIYAHFQTIPGYGDRGHLTFSGGTQDFAKISGPVPIEVTVNPTRIGKMVFFVESMNQADAAK